MGNGVTRNIVVKDLSTKNKIATASSVSLNSLKIDYIDNNRDQKSLTEFDVNFNEVEALWQSAKEIVIYLPQKIGKLPTRHIPM